MNAAFVHRLAAGCEQKELRFAVGGELKKVGVGSGAAPKAPRHMGGSGGGPPPGNCF